MFLDLSLNAKAKQMRGAVGKGFFCGLLCCSLLCAAFSTKSVYAAYSQSELRAVETEEEAKIRELRNQEINQLRIALGRRLAPNRQADLYYRLAEIYMEAYRIGFLSEGRVHESRLSKRIPDKFIDRSYSKPYLSLGIKACLEVLKYRLPHPHMDEIYYFLGFNYAELDRKAESAKYYSELVKKYPRSQFAGVAYKELAEYSYKTSDFRKAVVYFENARRTIPANLRPPILHRLAWAYYRIKNHERAITVMKEAIASAKDVGDKYGPLRQEALEDLAVLLAEVGREADAIAYFQAEVGDRDFFPRILEKLGERYERNVEIKKAIVVYETLLRTHPKSEEAFRVAAKLVELDLKQKNYKGALARLKQVRVPDGGETETQAAAQNLRVMTRKIAIDSHQSFRKKSGKTSASKSHGALSQSERSDLEIAEAFYSAYMDTFLKISDPHRELTEIQMYLAEVEERLGRFAQAVALYRVVVQSKDPKYAKQAAQSWVSSLVEEMKKNPSRSSEGGAPSAMEQEFISAADILVGSLENMNDGKEAKEVSLRAAQVQAGYASTRESSVVRIKDIISKWPRSAQAMAAAQLWVQLCNDQAGRSATQKSAGSEALNLEEALDQIRGNSVLLAYDASSNQGKLKSILDAHESKLKVGAIAKKERDKDYLGAAKSYEAFAQGSTDRETAEKAYANAMLSYLKAAGSSDGTESEAGVLGVLEAWEKRYPGSPKAIDPLRTIATNALINGRFEFSAQLFHKLGTAFGDAAALETSARLFEGTGDTARAGQEWVQFLNRYPTHPRRWAVALLLARSQEAAHQDSEANRSYRLCAKGPANYQAECLSRLADLYLKLKNVAQGKAFYQEVAGQKAGKKKGEAVSPYVGYARYQLASLAEAETSFDPLKFPEAQLKKALGQRLNFLEPLSRAYQSSVQVGGPWAIAALHRLALWAIRFADEVDAIEPPSSVQGPALEKFRKELSSISNPLREKARVTWSDSYAKANSMHLFSPALPEVADRLADFGVARPKRAQGPRGKLHLAGGSDASDAGLQKLRARLIVNTKEDATWVEYGNILWMQGKPLLAKIAYERATALNPKNLNALNNLAVVLILSEGEEDWVAVSGASQFLEEALRIDDFYVTAKVNLATLMNYYRIFAPAKSLWDQVLVRSQTASVTRDAQEGLGVALQGLGSSAGEKYLSGSETKFTAVYNEAARYSHTMAENAGRCLSKVRDLDADKLLGFEKSSVIYLEERCQAWKQRH